MTPGNYKSREAINSKYAVFFRIKQLIIDYLILYSQKDRDCYHLFSSKQETSDCYLTITIGMKKNLIKLEIAELIYVIRGQRVMLDSDLANLYKVETGQLNRSVKRNLERFPQDFMFQLSDQEFTDLKCQFGISRSWGGRRTHPFTFSEQGVAMLSSVLKSKEAALVNVQIMRAFVKMREFISAHKELSFKIEQLEYRMGKQDDDIIALFEAIKQLMEPVSKAKKRKIGFRQNKK